MEPNRTETVSDQVLDELQRVGTGTACGQLIKLGISRTYMNGISPVFPLGMNRRVVGRAVTARFLPLREDVAKAWRSDDLYRQTIDKMESKDVLVVDAMGCREGAVVGDILSTRIKCRKGIGAIVDGAVRDTTGIRAVGLPVFAKYLSAAPNHPYLISTDVNLPVQCGGVLVLPGDVILADDDGVVVIPQSLAAKVAAGGTASEDMELFVRSRVEQGVSICDIYPQTILREDTERQAGQH